MQTTTNPGIHRETTGMAVMSASSCQPIFRATQVPLLVIDGESGQVIDLNPAARRLLAVEKVEPSSLRVRAVSDFQDESLKTHLHAGTETTETVLTVFHGERAAGTLKAALTTIPWNTQRAILATGTEVSSQNSSKLADPALLQAALQSQRLADLGFMSGSVAHEFNNCLTMILGNAALAKMDIPAAGPLHRALVNIESAAERAALLCAQLSAQCIKESSAKKQVDLEGLLKDVAQLVGTTIGKRAKIEITVTPGTPKISVENGLMRQALLAAFLREIAVLPGGRGKISVNLTSRHQNSETQPNTSDAGGTKTGGHLVLEIRAVRVHLPNMDTSRPQPARPPTSHHLSMLSLTHLLRAAHGEVEIDPEDDTGHALRLLIPGTPPVAETSIQAGAPPTGALSIKEPATLLVVDDEAMLRKALSQMLTSCGLKTLQAAEGEEGLELYRRHRASITAVLLDSSMPTMSGLEVLDHIRQVSKDVPVILMSGFCESEITEICREDANVCFLQKPFNPDTLRRMLFPIINRAAPPCSIQAVA